MRPWSRSSCLLTCIILLNNLLLVKSLLRPRTLYNIKSRHTYRRDTIRAMFLEEVELRPCEAWVKDQPNKRILPSVFAIYNNEEVCVCVGASMDTIQLVKGLLQKHGSDTINELRCEAFMPENPDTGMMDMLKAAWLSDITKAQGGMAPVGNTESSWLVLPNEIEEASTNGNAHGIEPSKFQALTQEMANSGDSNASLFAAMNDAMARGDQEETARLMVKMTEVSASLPEENEV